MSDARKPMWDCDGAERAADEMSRTAARLHEMADAAEAGRNDVRIDPSGFHALAYYMESWSLSIDRTTCRDIGNCHMFVCSECGCELDVDDREGEPTMWDGGAPAVPRYCPNCGAKVVIDDE